MTELKWCINKIVNGKMFGQLFLLNEEILEDLYLLSDGISICSTDLLISSIEMQKHFLTHTQLDYYNPLPMLGVNKGKFKV